MQANVNYMLYLGVTNVRISLKQQLQWKVEKLGQEFMSVPLLCSPNQCSGGRAKSFALYSTMLMYFTLY